VTIDDHGGPRRLAVRRENTNWSGAPAGLYWPGPRLVPGGRDAAAPVPRVGVPGRRRGRGGSRGGRARNAPMPSRPHRPGRRAKLAPFYTAAARPAATHPLGGSHLLHCARARVTPMRSSSEIFDF